MPIHIPIAYSFLKYVKKRGNSFARPRDRQKINAEVPGFQHPLILKIQQFLAIIHVASTSLLSNQ